MFSLRRLAARWFVALFFSACAWIVLMLLCIGASMIGAVALDWWATLAEITGIAALSGILFSMGFSDVALGTD